VRELPRGTVTFLFTDIEGSTRLLHELGAEQYAQELAEHRRVLREAFERHGGIEVDTQGDSFFAAFPTAKSALDTAVEAMEGLARGPIRVRVGIHTGTPYVGEEGYVGVDVNRAARIAACGHGGQVLISASTAALLGTEELRDLGEHRLKDLAAPERIYQLGESEFEPLTSLYRTNLPIPPTAFLGRQHELADVLALLGRDDVRLLTLSGPGGTGKTRLAVQAAAEAAERHPDGVYWIPLAPLRDTELVLETARQLLGAKRGLAEHIADKSLLLLFDNFEHVIDAAGSLSELLVACPNLQMLVTSRELLRVPGEQAYQVPPLEPEDGNALFVARAHATLPDFIASDAVPELCTRLEQLPLALELAAARVGVLSPAQLLERLASRLDLLKGGRGGDPRQRTLRATIEWSYDLLNDDERELFARLAVFVGGCTLETVEEVCEADLDALQSLIDKSLVRVRDSRRFWMLETIREFAFERLQENPGHKSLRQRHGDWYLTLAERIAADETLELQPLYIRRLDDELDNLRAARSWFHESGQRDSEFRLLCALAEYWQVLGHMDEARGYFKAALAAGAPQSPILRARALAHASDFVRVPGTYDEARRVAEESLFLFRQAGDAAGVARALHELGETAAEEGNIDRASELFEQAIASGPSRKEVARSISNLGVMALLQKDYQRAIDLSQEAVELAREEGRKTGMAIALSNVADAQLGLGRRTEASRVLAECLRLAQETQFIEVSASALERAATLLIAADAETAARLMGAAAALFEHINFEMGPTDQHRFDGVLANVRAATPESADRLHEEGRLLTADEATALALAKLTTSAEPS